MCQLLHPKPNPKPTCSCHVPSCHPFRKSIKSDGNQYPKNGIQFVRRAFILLLKEPCWKTWIVGTRKEQKSPLCGCQLTAIWNHETCNIHNIVCLWMIYRKPQKFLYICFFFLLNYCWKKLANMMYMYVCWNIVLFCGIILLCCRIMDVLIQESFLTKKPVLATAPWHVLFHKIC